jgi:hypothetical protein
MEIVGGLAALLLSVTVLMPIQIAHDLGPLRTILLLVVIVVAVIVTRSLVKARTTGRHSRRR